MKLYQHYEDLPRPGEPCVVTIGSFDGLHRGHRLLIEKVRAHAQGAGLQSAVLTFRPHPAKVLAPLYSPPLLMSPERKVRALEALGLDATLVQRFDSEFAGLTAEDFSRRVLAEGLFARRVVIGDDFTFGRDRKGSAEHLADLGKRHGFEVEIVRRLSVEGILVSSTRIRSFLLQGKVRGAALLLGRPYRIQGEVVPGRGRGSGLGFPTANVKSDTEILPARGVYICHLHVAGNPQGMWAVCNVGHNPTFGHQELGVEVHVLSPPGELLGKKVAVGFIQRLRAEVRFQSPQALAEQIGLDVDEAVRVKEQQNEGVELDDVDGIVLDSGVVSHR
jgi:riboflavin kinase/FMN adenylyltransferase